MIVLGLGSNIGDRLKNIRSALRAIKNIPGLTVIKASPLYHSKALLPKNAMNSWDKDFINCALLCEGHLAPHLLLQQLKAIEVNLGRISQAQWAPRVIDIDILTYHEIELHSETLTIPHPALLERPFALWPLADIAPLVLLKNKTAAQWVERWGSRFTGDAPFKTYQLAHRLEGTQLIGVVNVTPDSMSDGGNYFDAEIACQHAAVLTAAGAEVIDIGAESTSFTARAITPQTEWARLEPVLTELIKRKSTFILPPKISIDTRHVEVAAKAIALGVDWINDVTGLDDSKMRECVINETVDCVIMHHHSIPEDRNNSLSRQQDPIPTILDWAENRIQTCISAGLPRDRIIFDPGIGFGKQAEQSLRVMQQIGAFKALNVRVLVGHSRKSFMKLLTSLPPAERDLETVVMSLSLAQAGIDYVRVHNVKDCAQALKTQAALLDFSHRVERAKYDNSIARLSTC